MRSAGRGGAWAWLALGGAVLALGGCRPFIDAEPTRPSYDDLFTPTLGATPAQAEVIDIQVFRDVTRLVLTNTTTRPLGAGRLWVNGSHSLQIEEVGPGQTLDLPLGKFVDRFGDRFRAGGFWATRSPEPVVLVQHEAVSAEDAAAGRAGPLVGLILVENDIR